MAWKAEVTGTFHRDYKKLSSEVKKRVDEAILGLLTNEDPTKLGLRKAGKWTGVYSYEIGQQFRLLYRVRFEDRVVELLDVGTHGVYR